MEEMLSKLPNPSVILVARSEDNSVMRCFARYLVLHYLPLSCLISVGSFWNFGSEIVFKIFLHRIEMGCRALWLCITLYVVDNITLQP